MVDASVLPGYALVIMLFLLPPGPDMAFMIAVGLEHGRRSAIAAVLGIGTGMSIYAAAVVTGVGRLAQSHPELLDVLKVGGAAYLLWLGIGSLRRAHRPGVGEGGVLPGGRAYRRGVVVTLTNPKIVLFFLAVLPQFMGDAHSTEQQMAMLGTVNVLAEVVLYGAVGVFAGTLHARFSASPKAGTTLNLAAGTVYLVLGVVVVAEVLANSALA